MDCRPRILTEILEQPTILAGDAIIERPVIFLSYSRKDIELKDELLEHLEVVRRFAGIRLWTDDDLAPGAEWQREIEKGLAEADVAILLVSSSFLASAFLQDVEVPRLLERRSAEGLIVIPVLLRACAWREHPWIQRMQVLPRSEKPIASHDARDEAFAEVVSEIARIVERADRAGGRRGASAGPPASLRRSRRGDAPASAYQPPESRRGDGLQLSLRFRKLRFALSLSFSVLVVALAWQMLTRDTLVAKEKLVATIAGVVASVDAGQEEPDELDGGPDAMEGELDAGDVSDGGLPARGSCMVRGAWCTYHLDCCRPLRCIDRKCVVCGTPGDACGSKDDCCDPLECTAGRCAGCGTKDDICKKNSDCCEGHYCFIGMCRECKPSGQYCANDAECCGSVKCVKSRCGG
jgi:hypothetical protein